MPMITLALTLLMIAFYKIQDEADAGSFTEGFAVWWFIISLFGTVAVVFISLMI